MSAFGRRRPTAEPIGLLPTVEAPEAPVPLRVLITGPLVELRTCACPASTRRRRRSCRRSAWHRRSSGC